MQDFFSIVGSFGFPVAVASYLLFRFERKLEELEKTNEEMVNEIKSLKDKVIELNLIIKKAKKIKI
jgi:cell division protein FtsB